MNLKWLCVTLVLAVAGGCDQQPSTPTRPQPTFGSGVIRGKVLLKTTMPTAAPIQNANCCPGAPATLPDESVIVNDKHELANVVIYLDNIASSDGSRAGPVTLDQKWCQYVPHVLAVQVGQKLHVTTSDPVPHNIHAIASANSGANFGLTTPGASRDLVFESPEIMTFKCDVHPWMTAHVAVVSNPFFTITRSDGSFEIEKIPAGNYTIKAWHERFGDVQKPVTIDNQHPTEINFDYEK